MGGCFTARSRRMAACPILYRHQPSPWAVQHAEEANDSGQQDVDLSRLDLLHRTDIQVHKFSQPFLRDAPSHPLTTDVGPKRDAVGIFPAFGHAPLRREANLTTTAQQGVNCRLSQVMNSALPFHHFNALLFCFWKTRWVPSFFLKNHRHDFRN